MPTTLPTQTRTINQAFTDTWQKIQAEVTDNVLTSTPLTAALQARGIFQTQAGGDQYTETVGYGTLDSEVKYIGKGSKLVAADSELDTTARWTPRNLAIPSRRTPQDDVVNRGEYQIKSYIERRLQATRDALSKELETALIRASGAETRSEFQSIQDAVPNAANRATGTYGLITRCSAYSDDSADAQDEVPNSASSTVNPWWAPRYRKFTEPVAVNLETDMRAIYNKVADNFDPPDLIVTTQQIMQQYEETVGDKAQITVGVDTSVAKLGFQEFYYKQASMVYSTNCPTSTMFFLTTPFWKFIYDPMLWFTMTDWVEVAGEHAFQASIIVRGNLICNHLRRQGRLYRASVG